MKSPLLQIVVILTTSVLVVLSIMSISLQSLTEGGRTSHTDVLLKDGKVLITGGQASSFPNAGERLLAVFTGRYREPTVRKDCKLYDAVLNSFISTGDLGRNRQEHTATLLDNGKVLVAGGWVEDSEDKLACELYDPATGKWTDSGRLNNFHGIGSKAVRLHNGKIMLVGSRSCEIYDPLTNQWESGATMNCRENYPTVTLLKDGRVLVVGGGGKNNKGMGFAEVYDPGLKKWLSISQPRYMYNLNGAVALNNVNILVIGGRDPNCELYNSLSDTWTETGKLRVCRRAYSSTLLLNGKVLVAGGAEDPRDYSNMIALNDCELYDPVSGTWTPTGSLNVSRQSHQATLLPNGKVLVTGGEKTGGVPIKQNEIYDPSTGSWKLAP